MRRKRASQDPAAQQDFLSQIDLQNNKDQPQAQQQPGKGKESNDQGTPPSEEHSFEEGDFEAPTSEESPQESPEQHAKRMLLSAIVDRKLCIDKAFRSSLENVTSESCAKGMQAIAEYDQSAQGQAMKRKLEIQIEQIIDEDQGKQWRERRQQSEATQEGPEKTSSSTNAEKPKQEAESSNEQTSKECEECRCKPEYRYMCNKCGKWYCTGRSEEQGHT